jgi:hypothetical protein
MSRNEYEMQNDEESPHVKIITAVTCMRLNVDRICNILTPSSRIILDKMKIAEVVMKCQLLWKAKDHCPIYKSLF